MKDRIFRRALRSATSPDSTGKMSACPDDNTIAAYLDKALTPGQKAGFEEHVSRCPSCRELVGLAVSIGDSGSSPSICSTPALEMHSRRSWWMARPAISLAALAVVAVGVGVLLFRAGSEQPSRRETQIASVQRETAAPPAEILRGPESGSDAGKHASGDLRRPAAPAAEFAARRHASPGAPVRSVAEFKGKAPAETGSGQSAVPATMPAGTPGAADSAAAPSSRKEEAAEAPPGDFAVSSRNDQAGITRPQKANQASPERAPARSAVARFAPGTESPTSAMEALRLLLGSGQTDAPRQAVGEFVFYRIGSYWIDGRCTDDGKALIVELKPDSPELRSVLAALPDLSNLSVHGVRVMIWRDGKIWVLPEP